MEDQIRIAAIVPYTIFPAKMGGQKGIASFYQYLKELYPVTLFTTSDTIAPDEFKENVLPVIGSKSSRYYNFFLVNRLARIIRQKKITHLILEHPYYAWLKKKKKKKCGIQLIVHSHNIEALRFKSTGRWWWRLLWQYEKHLHQHADLNFFITDEDRNFAIKNYQLPSSKCVTITYGMDRESPPSFSERNNAKLELQKRYGIDTDDKILFFNGTLNYKPNLDAVDVILHSINPLLQKNGFKCTTIICGKNLPENYHSLTKFKNDKIIYAGFVDDINEYFLGSDIFLNPVIEGGGIKTKLVEALGFNLSCITTQSGGIGIPPNVSGAKLKVVADGNWNDFSKSVIENQQGDIPSEFFKYFYWGNIAKKAAYCITETQK